MTNTQTSNLEHGLGPMPAGPAPLDSSTWEGPEEEMQVFPQFARTTDPKILELWAKSDKAESEWLQWVDSLVRQATGNTQAKPVIDFGDRIEAFYLRGVRAKYVSEQMGRYWNEPEEGKSYRTWKKEHPLADSLGSASFQLPNLGGLPAGIVNPPYVHGFFVHEFEGALWARFTEDPAKSVSKRDVAWWPELSPWEPVEASAYNEVRNKLMAARIKEQ